MFDSGRRVNALKSIFQSPVVLGVRKSKAEALGWTQGPVSMPDIVAAVESGKLRFLMTSATHPDSGASAYMAMLSAALGSKAVMTEADLSGASANSPAVCCAASNGHPARAAGWPTYTFRRCEGRRL